MCVAIGGFPWFQKTPVLLRLSVVAIMVELQLQRAACEGISPPQPVRTRLLRLTLSPNSDKETNGLFPVHVHVSEKGLIFVNLSADQNVTPFEVHAFIESLI